MASDHTINKLLPNFQRKGRYYTQYSFHMVDGGNVKFCGAVILENSGSTYLKFGYIVVIGIRVNFIKIGSSSFRVFISGKFEN